MPTYTIHVHAVPYANDFIEHIQLDTTQLCPVYICVRRIATAHNNVVNVLLLLKENKDYYYYYYYKIINNKPYWARHKKFYVLLPYIIYVMESGRVSQYPAFRQKSGIKSTV